MEKEQVLSDITRIKGWLSTREQKYIRNFNRYFNNGARREDLWTTYGETLGYGRELYTNNNSVPIVNVIRSIIDTRQSKLSQNKPRPFFNPIQGTYKTRKVCRSAQIFFDEYFDKEDIYKKAIEAERDSEIFEYGALWIDDEDMSVYKLQPWEFFFDPAEMGLNKISRCYIKRKNYPLNSLNKKIKAHPIVKEMLNIDQFATGEYVIYYDLLNKEKHIIIAGQYIHKVKIAYSVCPVEVIWYVSPIKGGRSVSTVDNLYSIQEQIDQISQKISEAHTLSPGMMIFVPKGSQINPSIIDNEVGKIWEYQPLPGMGGSPVEVATPRFIDGQYLSILQYYIQTAYQQEGISELSAQSKKPSGLNSGVALQTMEDVESERHNIIIQNYIRFLMGIAHKMIEIFPEDADVLPENYNRSKIKWKDIKKERDAFTIQFSASTSLSKDPKTKMEQIEKLLSMQLINPSIAAQLLEFPDLEDAYSISTASYDDCQKIIERAIDKDEYDFYEITNLDQLLGEVINTALRLDANDEDPLVMERIMELLRQVKAKKNDVMQELNPPLPPPPPLPLEQLPPEMMVPPEQLPPEMGSM